jgi:hypothetical protein
MPLYCRYRAVKEDRIAIIAGKFTMQKRHMLNMMRDSSQRGAKDRQERRSYLKVATLSAFMLTFNFILKVGNKCMAPD